MPKCQKIFQLAVLAVLAGTLTVTTATVHIPPPGSDSVRGCGGGRPGCGD
jgi:hypothetical protein